MRKISLPYIPTPIKKDILTSIWQGGVLWSLLNFIVSTQQGLLIISILCLLFVVISVHTALQPMKYLNQEEEADGQ
jgi:hypothetical protein